MFLKICIELLTHLHINKLGAWMEMMTNKVNFHGSNEEKGW
jgi:hypothetical protein